MNTVPPQVSFKLTYLQGQGSRTPCAQVEEARLSQWYAVKSRAWTKAKELFKSARSSLNKRIGKAEEVREATLQEVNIVFNQCAPLHVTPGAMLMLQHFQVSCPLVMMQRVHLVLSGELSTYDAACFCNMSVLPLLYALVCWSRQALQLTFSLRLRYLCMRGNSGSIRVDQTAAKLSIKVKVRTCKS